MVVDGVDVDGDRRVVGRRGHRLLEDAGPAPGGQCDVALREDCERYVRLLAQPRQGPAIAPKAEQDAAILRALGRGHGDRVGADIDGAEYGDRPRGPVGQRLAARVLGHDARQRTGAVAVLGLIRRRRAAKPASGGCGQERHCQIDHQDH